ncbi:MAG: delta-aminolevulinic acid dehydratase [Xenococcaceae cyanobacterium MO_188.B29]|nr:delta-aminolevulinic acid dehydratase [Xenococcaceae cyanobacterium MO_188.B29]
MTLINSEEFHAMVNALGTTIFALTMLWTFWFASRMD